MIGVVSKDDLAIITGKKLAGAQCRALLLMNIPYTMRPDGTPCVLRKAVEQSCGVHPDDNSEAKFTLNLESI